ncbi:MAG: hypothetical protein L6R42_007458 [Xanthoria sp. 1 TBL-2021]|nr:MAG: hypothetical protein L6R42_007458 [Xanthoria sp. 1 TBL-2021]
MPEQGRKHSLSTLADDPQQLDRARRRFSASPPFHKSPTPGSTTFNSPTPPTASEIQRDRELKEQVHDEKQWLFKAQDEVGVRLPVGANYEKLASAVVKKRWREQGIWNDRWDKLRDWCAWCWKHEEADPESESEYKKESTTPAEPERQAKLDRDREALPPIHQFLCQLARQRDLISGKPTIQKAAVSASLDINTKAYEAVKSSWIRQDIWDTEWGIMPGMTWMYERPPDQTVRADPTPAHARENSFAILELEAEARRLFPKPPTPPKLHASPPFVDEWGLFRKPTDPLPQKPANTNSRMESEVNSSKNPLGAATKPSIPLADEDRPLMKAADVINHYPDDHPDDHNTTNSAPSNLDQERHDPSNTVNSQDCILHPSEIPTRSQTQRPMRDRRKKPSAPQKTLAQDHQPKPNLATSQATKSSTKKAPPPEHVEEATEHSSSEPRIATDVAAEIEYPGGRRRSKRLRQEIREENFIDGPSADNEFPPPTKRAKRRTSNVGAKTASGQEMDEIAIAKSRRITRQEEQQSNGAGTQ